MGFSHYFLLDPCQEHLYVKVRPSSVVLPGLWQGTPEQLGRGCDVAAAQAEPPQLLFSAAFLLLASFSFIFF